MHFVLTLCTISCYNYIGQYGQVNNVKDLGGILPRQQYLAHEMNKLGYQTAIVKVHLKEAPEL